MVGHYPLFMSLIVPPWPKISRKNHDDGVARFNQEALRLTCNNPRLRSAAKTDLDAFVCEHSPPIDVLTGVSINHHAHLHNTIFRRGVSLGFHSCHMLVRRGSQILHTSW